MSQGERTEALIASRDQALLGRFIEVASAEKVFGEPVTSGAYTVVPVAEVRVAMGVGHGSGKGGSDVHLSAGGGGGGGGGYTVGRPVAVISVGPSGVEVIPIIDRTRLALACFAAAGGMLALVSEVLKARGRRAS